MKMIFAKGILIRIPFFDRRNIHNSVILRNEKTTCHLDMGFNLVFGLF